MWLESSREGFLHFFFVVCGVYDMRLWHPMCSLMKKTHPLPHMVNQQNQWGHFHPAPQRLPFSLPCRVGKDPTGHAEYRCEKWKRRPQFAIYFGRCWFGKLFLAMNSSMLCVLHFLGSEGKHTGQLWTPTWLSFITIWNIYSSLASYF